MFGKILRQLRKERGLTQAELASVLHLDASSISKYEKADVSPSAEVLLKAAQYFGVSTDYLLGKTDIKNPPTSEDMSGLTPKQMKIIEMMEQMTPEQQDEMVRQAEYQLWQRQHQTGGQ